MRRTVLILGLLAAVANPTAAQPPLDLPPLRNEPQPAALSPDVRALINRLEKAEQKITDLQKELRGQKQPRPSKVVRDPYSFPAVFDDPLKAPKAPMGANAKYDEKLDDLSKKFDKLAKENAELRKSNDELEEAQEEFDDRLIKMVTRSSSNVGIRVFGRMHGDYWAFPNASPGISAIEAVDGNPGGAPEDRFLWRRLRIGVRGDIKDNMLYKFELEMASPNDLEYRDLFIGFTNLPFLQTVLVGNQKRPFGLDHLNSSRYNVFIARPFIIEGNNEDARRMGVQSWGHTDDLVYNWRFGIFNLEKNQDDGQYVADHYQPQIAGRLAHTWWWDEYSDGRGYGHFAISGAIAWPDGNDAGDDSNSNDARFRTRPEGRSFTRWLNTGRIPGAETFEIGGLETVFNVGPLQIVAEAQGLWLQSSDPRVNDPFFWGGYVQASYFITGEHMPWDRKTGQLARPKPFENFFLVERANGNKGGGWGAWQVALRYSYADYNDGGIFGGIGSAVTFGLNWYWNPNARLQFNYVRGTITDRRLDDGSDFGGAIVSGDYDIIGARFMIDF